MLKTAFIGHENEFTYLICDWLAEHTDLKLIIWTEKMFWAHGHGLVRARRVLSRFLKRARKKGLFRTADEFLYFLLYRPLIVPRESRQIHKAILAARGQPPRPSSKIKQLWPTDIRSPELVESIKSMDIDAAFSMCIDVYFPLALVQAPRLGIYLWHEGITPEYRGVHSPFWALYNEDYDHLGYTLLKMNAKLDAGEIFVQGKAQNYDPLRDWHSYIGHKAVLDSLPAVEKFVHELEAGTASPISREGAPDAYYSYATGSALMKIAARRFWRRLTKK